MKKITQSLNPEQVVYGSHYGDITYDEWIDRELIRLNRGLPNYAFKKTDNREGKVCIVANTSKLPAIN